MISWRIIQLRYYFKKRTYKPRTITIPKRSMYTQNAGNCWIYSMMNNLYLNTGIVVDPDEIKDYISSFGISVNTGNDTNISGPMICEFLKARNLCCYEIDVMTQPQLFAQLLLKGYSFTYTRDCHNNVLQDILDDNEIDEIITSMGAWHAVNLCYINQRLTEFGSRGDNSVYNNFSYVSIGVFYKSIRAGAITTKVRFLDFKQNVNG